MFKRTAIIFSLLVVFYIPINWVWSCKGLCSGRNYFDAPKETHLIPDIYNVRYRILKCRRSKDN